MISIDPSTAQTRTTGVTLPTLLLLFVFLTSVLSTMACSRKSGCPVNDQATTKVDRKGGFSKNKNSSNLFPKDMRKKMKQ